MSDRARVEGGTGEEGSEQLLDAAEGVIRERGYEGLSPPTEWELFSGVMKRDEGRFNAVVDSALAAADTPGDGLLALIEACVVDYDWSYWIELWSAGLRDPRAQELRTQLEREFRARVADVIEEGRVAGAFEVQDTEATATVIGSLIDVLAVNATLGDDTVSPNFMLRACAAAAGRLVGAELELRGRDEDG